MNASPLQLIFERVTGMYCLCMPTYRPLVGSSRTEPECPSHPVLLSVSVSGVSSDLRPGRVLRGLLGYQSGSCIRSNL